MAKRSKSSARRSELHDDDEFAWQTPKKKKKKKKKKRSTDSASGTEGSGRTRSTKKKSTRSRSGKSKRKSAREELAGSSRSSRSSSRSSRKSGRRPGSGAHELEGSGRRRRVPAKAKKGINPVIPISAVTLSLLLFVGVLIFRNDPPPPARDEPQMLEDARKTMAEADKAYSAWNAAKRSKDADAEAEHHREAIALYEKADSQLGAVLDKYRTEDDQLPDAYGHYEADEVHISKRLQDLAKGARLGG